MAVTDIFQVFPRERTLNTLNHHRELRATGIEEHGDTPQTRIVAEYHRKLALGIQTTAEDYLAYLEAQVHLNPDDEIGPRLLERFRKAKADGIPFKDVKTDDIASPKDDNE